jgi:hypothetical protein
MARQCVSLGRLEYEAELPMESTTEHSFTTAGGELSGWFTSRLNISCAGSSMNQQI